MRASLVLIVLLLVMLASLISGASLAQKRPQPVPAHHTAQFVKSTPTVQVAADVCRTSPLSSARC